MSAKLLTLILCAVITFNTSALRRSAQVRANTLLAAQQAISSLPEASQTQFIEIQSILIGLTPSQQRKLISNMYEQVSLMRDSTTSSLALTAQENINKLQSILKGTGLSSAFQAQMMTIVYNIIALISKVTSAEQSAVIEEMESITDIVTASSDNQTAQLAIQNKILKARQALSSLGINPQTNFFNFVKTLAALIKSSGLSSCTSSFRDLQAELYSSMTELAQYITTFTTDDDRTAQIDLHRDMLLTRQRLNSLTSPSQLTFFQNITDLASLAISDISFSGFQLKNQSAMVGILKALQSCTIDLQNKFIQQLADDTTLMITKEAERIYQVDNIQSDIIAARKELSTLPIERQISFFKGVLDDARVLTGSVQASSDEIVMTQNINGVKAAILNFTLDEKNDFWGKVKNLATFIANLSNNGTQRREDHIELQDNILPIQDTLRNVENTNRIDFLSYTNSAAAFIAALDNSGNSEIRSDHIDLLSRGLTIQRSLLEVSNANRINFYTRINELATFIAGLSNSNNQLISDHIAQQPNILTIQDTLKSIANTNRTNFYTRVKELATFISGLSNSGNQLMSDHVDLLSRGLTIQRSLLNVSNANRTNFYTRVNELATFILGLNDSGNQLRSDHIALQSNILTIQDTLKNIANIDRTTFWSELNNTAKLIADTSTSASDRSNILGIQTKLDTFTQLNEQLRFYVQEYNLANFISGLSNLGNQLRSDHIAQQPNILTIQNTLKDIANTERTNFYTRVKELATFIAGLNNSDNQLRSDHIAQQSNILTIQDTLKSIANTERTNFYNRVNELATFIVGLSNSSNQLRSDHIALQSNILTVQDTLKNITNTERTNFYTRVNELATFIAGLNNSDNQLRSDHIAQQPNILTVQKTLKNITNTDRTTFWGKLNNTAKLIADASISASDRSNILGIQSKLDTFSTSTDKIQFYVQEYNLADFISGLSNSGNQLRRDHIAQQSNILTVQKTLKNITNTDKTTFWSELDNTAKLIADTSISTSDRSNILGIQTKLDTFNTSTDKIQFYVQEYNLADFISGLSNSGNQLRSDHIALQSNILTIQKTLKDIANTERTNFYTRVNELATFIAGLNNSDNQLRSDHIAQQSNILTIQKTLKDIVNTDRTTFWGKLNNTAQLIADASISASDRSNILGIQTKLDTFNTSADKIQFYVQEYNLADFISGLSNSGNQLRSDHIALQSNILTVQDTLKNIPIAAQQAFFNTLETMASRVNTKIGTSTDASFTTQTATYMVTPGGIAQRAHSIKSTSTTGNDLNDLTAFIDPNFLSTKTSNGFGTCLIAFLRTTSYNAGSFNNLKSKLSGITATTYTSTYVMNGQTYSYEAATKLSNLKTVISQQYADSNFYFAQSQDTILQNMKAAMDIDGATSYNLVKSLAINLLVSAELRA